MRRCLFPGQNVCIIEKEETRKKTSIEKSCTRVLSPSLFCFLSVSSRSVLCPERLQVPNYFSPFSKERFDENTKDQDKEGGDGETETRLLREGMYPSFVHVPAGLVLNFNFGSVEEGKKNEMR